MKRLISFHVDYLLLCLLRHFLLECGDFAHVRNNCFHVDSIKELFQDIHIDSMMTFLRQINLFNKI